MDLHLFVHLDGGDDAVGELERLKLGDSHGGEGEEGRGPGLHTREVHGAQERVLHPDVGHEVVMAVPDADADRYAATVRLRYHQPQHLHRVVPGQIRGRALEQEQA